MSSASMNKSSRLVLQLISSVFQPVFSFAHRRPVGYEGLVRGADADGKTYSATELLAKAPAGVARSQKNAASRWSVTLT